MNDRSMILYLIGFLIGLPAAWLIMELDYATYSTRKLILVWVLSIALLVGGLLVVYATVLL